MFKDIIAPYSENNTKPINTFSGQNIELLILKADAIYKYHFVLKC
jgi:hypothetical protein